MTNLNLKLIAEIIGGALFVLLIIWYFFFRSTTTLAPTDTAAQQTFGQSDTRTETGATSADGDGTNAAERIESPISKDKIFKISAGPVAGAAFMQELRPTTTIARFVMQQNGHILDLAIDSPGSVARAASNTTIPGVANVVWEMQSDAARLVAAGAALQYLDGATTKTVVLTFPTATTSTSTPQAAQSPVRIQFLPNDITALAASVDGKSIAYSLGAQGGTDTYTARADGSSPKKLFSLPLSQITLSWPAPSVLLAASKPAAGVPGIALSASASTGALTPLLYAQGLTATADQSFSSIVYQTVGAGRTSYIHDAKSGLDRPLSFDPSPERCVWSRTLSGVMYCAVPLGYVPANYLDLWHQGSASAPDSIISYNLLTGQAIILATPGGSDGGAASDIAGLALSQDDKYILFVKKGDRSLWGMRLY